MWILGLSAFDPLQTLEAPVETISMKSVHTWVLFFVASAALSYVVLDDWTGRILGFLIMTIPAVIWAASRKRAD